ncbi:MAG: YggS family pyridoxal phosphate-dependent enzyme [Caldilineales bacterium]|nr:YggS family pyridoxal phosphate-dependent enzyme [Caldilineales bacterium]
MIPPIAQNLAAVHDRIAAAAVAAGRDPAQITLVAVTKTHPWAFVAAALAAGQIDFGENRPEEAHEKFGAAPPAVTPAPRLHLIGPIQSRKARMAIACRPALIHSIDRPKIARKLSELAEEAGIVLDVLCEVNVAGEASKFGFTPAGLRAALPELLALPGLRVCGLMTIPPFAPDPAASQPHFQALADLRAGLIQAYPQVSWRHLSMGMSHDFEIAIAEGATLVRVGSAIFGPRP